MFKARFKSWGWQKNQTQTISRSVLATRQATSPSSPIISPLLRIQTILIRQLTQYIETDLRPFSWSGGPGSYYQSDSALSISNIIQGNLLVRRGYHQGFRMINRGFGKIGKVLQKHTLYGLMDMLLFLHMHCDEAIIRQVWGYLRGYSAEVLRTPHRFHASLEHLRGLATATEAPYKETILQTQIQVYHEFRLLGAERDPCLLSLMCNGVASLLSTSPWKDSDWKAFLMTSLDEMRISMRDNYGVNNASYHVWLRKHLGSIRNLCGEDSDEAFTLATHIEKEMRGTGCSNFGLQQECRITMGQYFWRQYSVTSDRLNPRAALAISYMEQYTEGSREVGLQDDSQLQMLRTLQSWQTGAGYEMDANKTASRCCQMLEDISRLSIQ